MTMATEYNYQIPHELDFTYDEDWIAMVDSRWRKYKTYAGLLKNMAKFIIGKIPNTPVHLGAMQDTDPAYIQKLLDLNARDVLSINGQEYTHNIKRDEIYMQREYLDFALKLPKNRPQEYLQQLVANFNAGDFYYCAIEYDSKLVFQTPGLGRIDFDNPEFWVSRTLNRKEKTYSNQTHVLEPCDILNTFSDFNRYAKDLFPRGMFLQVWAKTWEEEPDYLLDRILAALPI